MEKHESHNEQNEFIFEATEKSEKAFSHYVMSFGLTENDLHKSILDVGAGEAGFIKYLRDHGNEKAFAVDLFVDLFNRGGRKDQNWFLAADIQRLPFKDDTFELVLSLAVVPIFIQPEYPATNYGREMDYKNLISELVRVVKPKGRIMFDYFDRGSCLAHKSHESKDDEQMQRYWEARAKIADEFNEFINNLSDVDVSIQTHSGWSRVMCLTKVGGR